VSDVPAIDRLCLGLDGATGEHSVIDISAHDTQNRGRFKRIGIFIAIQRDDGKAFAYAADDSIACSALMRCLPGIRVSVE
jgi:hypothetical protein